MNDSDSLFMKAKSPSSNTSKYSHSSEWFFYAQNLINMKLETTNPHCFTYKTEELLIELLGGVRVKGLDRNAGNNKSNCGKQKAHSLPE